jgi:hypothetical protein
MATRTRVTVIAADDARIEATLNPENHRPALGLVHLTFWPGTDVFLTEQAAGQLIDAVVEALASLPDGGAS